MPGANVGEGLTTVDLGRPDLPTMLAQHAACVRALEAVGAAVTVLDADPRFPDGCFVEDTAVVAGELAVITRPGAPSRRGEEAAIAPLLARDYEIARIEAPGTVDGGDIIIAGDRALIGRSARTNADGARQLAALLGRHGIRAELVAVSGGLHLKSDVSRIGDRLLLTRACASRPEFADFSRLTVPDGEEYAANCVDTGERLLVADGFPRTRELLERAGFAVTALAVSEFRKMDGGLSCLSIRL